MRRTVQLVVAVLVMLGSSFAFAGSASAAVLHPDENVCFFEPGDVPGVNVFFQGECTIVTTGNGSRNIVARAQLPEGFSLTKTFVGTLPCFGETGRITATVSGQVTATCHLTP
jgi:hypothetical protein